MRSCTVTYFEELTEDEETPRLEVPNCRNRRSKQSNIDKKPIPQQHNRNGNNYPKDNGNQKEAKHEGQRKEELETPLYKLVVPWQMRSCTNVLRIRSTIDGQSVHRTPSNLQLRDPHHESLSSLLRQVPTVNHLAVDNQTSSGSITNVVGDVGGQVGTADDIAMPVAVKVDAVGDVQHDQSHPEIEAQ